MLRLDAVRSLPQGDERGIEHLVKTLADENHHFLNMHMHTGAIITEKLNVHDFKPSQSLKFDLLR